MKTKAKQADLFSIVEEMEVTAKGTLTHTLNIPEIKLSYTLSKRFKSADLETISSSIDAANKLRQLLDNDTMDFQEQFLVLLLNRANQIVGYYPTSKGGITGTVADPRIILAAALRVMACSMILCHNHPSGNTKPSIADQDLTLKIKEAAKYLDIKVLDHVIITRESYFSFADEGMI